MSLFAALAGLLSLLALGFVCVQLGFSLSLTGPGQAAWVLLLGPALEEWVFRALLQAEVEAKLRTRHSRFGHSHLAHIANFVAAIAFACAHIPARGTDAWLWVFPGLLLGEVWRRTHNIWACVLLHSLMNASLALATILW